MRQNERWLVVLGVLAASFAAVAGIIGALQESLWLDELHTAWCTSGPATQVAQRAQLGNQLSPFFHGIWAWCQLWGLSEASLRAPAAITWLAAIAVLLCCLSRLAQQSQDSWLLAVIAAALTDRSQWFYATEARVYALLALINLLAWLALERWSAAWFFPVAGRSRWRPREWCLWCGLLAAAGWLQPTSILIIVSHFIFLIGLWLTQGRRQAWRASGLILIASGAAVGMLLLPTLSGFWPVWQQRQLWAAFAARHDWSAVRALLPWDALVIPVLVASGLWWLARRSRRVVDRAADVHVTCDINTRRWWMWLCAWCLPCVCVYLLALSGQAALMHRRYVFAASLPLVMWLAISLASLPKSKWRLVILTLSLLMLWYQQGSIESLKAGRWPTAQRGEDWRGAVAWINQQSPADETVWVFCASSLIEAAEPSSVLQSLRDSQLPQLSSDSSTCDRASYFTFPLRTLYRLSPSVYVVPLANDPKSWAASWRQVGRPRPECQWLVVRCSARALSQRLAAAGLVGAEHRDFGGVQVVRDVGFKD